MKRLLNTLSRLIRSHQPMLIYPVKPFANHVTQDAAIIRILTTQYASPAGYLNWQSVTGLQLPDGHSKPLVLGELILLHHTRTVTVFTIASVRYRANNRLHTMHYAWIRHDTYFTASDYNPVPQPHGDERVQVWDSDVVTTIFRLLDEDMRGDS